MPIRFRTQDVRRAVVQDAEAELRARAGSNGIVSRQEAAALSGGLKGAVDKVREDRGAGARVTVRDAVGAYDAAVGAAFAAVNTQGTEWLSAAETSRLSDPDLKARVWNVRARMTSGLSDAALERKMTAHVAANSEPNPFVRTGATYPAANSGSAGLFAHRITGDRANALVEISRLWNGRLDLPDVLAGFDPDEQDLLAVRTTHHDREALILSTVDRRTGQVGAATIPLTIGEIYHFVSEADFTRLVGPKESFGADEYSYWKLDHRLVMQRLVEGTRKVDVGNPLVGFPDDRAQAIVAEVDAAVARAGLTGMKVVVAPPVIAAQQALPGNTVTFGEAVSKALDALMTSVVDGSSPLSICQQVLMDQAGTTTLTPDIAAAAQARLKDHVTRPTTTLRALDLDEEPEGGSGPEKHWVIQLDIPELSSDVHWALVDRTGREPVQLISFN